MAPAARAGCCLLRGNRKQGSLSVTEGSAWPEGRRRVDSEQVVEMNLNHLHGRLGVDCSGFAFLQLCLELRECTLQSDPTDQHPWLLPPFPPSIVLLAHAEILQYLEGTGVATSGRATGKNSDKISSRRILATFCLKCSTPLLKWKPARTPARQWRTPFLGALRFSLTCMCN